MQSRSVIHEKPCIMSSHEFVLFIYVAHRWRYCGCEKDWSLDVDVFATLQLARLRGFSMTSFCLLHMYTCMDMGLARFLMLDGFYSYSLFNINLINLIFNWYSGGLESNWVHSALRPLIGLFCQPRVIMMMEKLVEWLAGKPKYSGKTCPSATSSTTNPTCCPDANPGCRGGKPAINRLSYGTIVLHG
jgi:hypothetical protein